jgi:hypothetical protein
MRRGRPAAPGAVGLRLVGLLVFVLVLGIGAGTLLNPRMVAPRRCVTAPHRTRDITPELWVLQG